jgi:hypothetical protein
MANDWRQYQEEAADFFRSLGLEATTNHTVQGVRTTHDIDVFISKARRIDCGLGPEVGVVGYSGNHVIDLANEMLSKAFRGTYPVDIDSIGAVVILGGLRQFSSATEVLSVVEPLNAELEAKLDECDAKESEAIRRAASDRDV